MSLVKKEKVEDEVRIPLSKYMGIINSIENSTISHPPQNHSLTFLEISGEAKKSCVSLSFKIEATILSNDYVLIPLFPSTMAIYDLNVKSNSNKEEKIESCLAVQNSVQHLGIQGTGKYTITCHAQAAYSNFRKNDIVLAIPMTCCGKLNFVVPQTRLQITSIPSLSRELKAETNQTTLTATFPPTKQIHIQWTEDATNQSKSENKIPSRLEEQIVTSVQETIFSVGEGVLNVRSSFQFDLVHASRSSISVAVDEKLSLVQIDGDEIKRYWFSEPELELHQSQGDLAEKPHKGKKILHIELNFAVVDKYKFDVTLETSTGGTSAKNLELQIPYCLNIVREKAQILVEARTNVEVDEVTSYCISPIDISELSQSIRDKSTNPIIAYQTLFPVSSSVTINVIKHQEAEVLITTIEKAHYELIVSSEGKCLHNLRLSVRNSQKQYLRAKLPDGCEIWSTVVAEKPTKPATDSEGRVMIPLVKSNGKTAQKPFSVDIIFVVPSRNMNKKGILDISLGYFDVPINFLGVSVYLPQHLKYSKFEGDLEKVTAFSNSINIPKDIQPVNAALQQRVRRDSRQMNTYDYKEEKIMTKKRAGGHVGVVPVRVDVITVGTRFCFEKILMQSKPHNIRIHYSQSSSFLCF